MCNFFLRVYTCGHYKKTLSNPCEPAKRKQEARESGNEVSVTTGLFCYRDGCDREAGGCREGPGMLCCS
ncbi:hypothetical protein B0T19DRAFT_112832 [Cercophora scortea]|uniref:Uncharacterized protein n=1 Tax=Cercophora scortea TaxID=314031 RepID=A0AAE0IX44_9PEZI|nr:hypothetical protein B0T19DRAFT_112832 [Cercophora scortea]